MRPSQPSFVGSEAVRLALCIGIDDYPGSPLHGCVADAEAIASLLARNDDGSPNFTVDTVTSKTASITRGSLKNAALDLFAGDKDDADILLFYFAGHGGKERSSGSLVTPDASAGDEGVSMAAIIGAANESKARERIVILDCCHADAITEQLASQGGVPLAEGVTVIAACRSNQYAAERGGRGLFTSRLCDGLEGGAADVRGCVTIGGLYAYVSEVLSHRDQRPMFKTNLARVSALRKAAAAVPDDKLRQLTGLFPSRDRRLRLDPSFEPTAEPRHSANEASFALLQQCRAARLVVPTSHVHLYDAAMDSGTCHLTPLGQFYWEAVRAHRI